MRYSTWYVARCASYICWYILSCNWLHDGLFMCTCLSHLATHLLHVVLHAWGMYHTSCWMCLSCIQLHLTLAHHICGDMHERWVVTCRYIPSCDSNTYQVLYHIPTRGNICCSTWHTPFYLTQQGISDSNKRSIDNHFFKVLVQIHYSQCSLINFMVETFI